MKVENVMIKNVKSILPDISVKKAMVLLSENKISGLPVIDSEGKLEGMLTEKDILNYILPGYLKKVGSFIYQDNPKAIGNKVKELSQERKVGDIMRRDIITVKPEASLSEVARTMLTERVRRIPVVDKEDKVIGIIAREDVVKAFMK
ncbi:HPP family protein, partial [Candidatus Omnitrophota bacterium]